MSGLRGKRSEMATMGELREIGWRNLGIRHNELLKVSGKVKGNC